MEIYFVTHNPSKYEEAFDLAKQFKIQLLWKNIEYEEPQESDLESIAFRSCKGIIEKNPELNNLVFFLEDAGLFIRTLNGFPGPYSAYVFKTLGNEGILKLMEKNENREAFFKSVVAFYSREEIKLFNGITKGIITQSIQGEGGFGFDPIFKPDDSEQTFSEMTLRTKNLYSHRQKSLRELFTSITAFDKNKLVK
ncbi:XTP/dITP diphosphatase [Candidatus Heimdallarchaeota archaeon]|nr:MAG: XTP/dITP diphosphatase [Candidatus Heimdallarchaeota archaeon]